MRTWHVVCAAWASAPAHRSRTADAGAHRTSCNTPKAGTSSSLNWHGRVQAVEADPDRALDVTGPGANSKGRGAQRFVQRGLCGGFAPHESSYNAKHRFQGGGEAV